MVTPNALRKRSQYRREIAIPSNKLARLKASRAFQRTRRSLYATNKARAKQLGIPFSITFAEFIAAWPLDNECRYCRRFMLRQTGSAPSADRIIPGRGYIATNVDIICRDCNRLKSGGDVVFHETVAARMREVL